MHTPIQTYVYVGAAYVIVRTRPWTARIRPDASVEVDSRGVRRTALDLALQVNQQRAAEYLRLRGVREYGSLAQQRREQGRWWTFHDGMSPIHLGPSLLGPLGPRGRLCLFVCTYARTYMFFVVLLWLCSRLWPPRWEWDNNTGTWNRP